jgi:hypothetical protein
MISLLLISKICRFRQQIIVKWWSTRHSIVWMGIKLSINSQSQSSLILSSTQWILNKASSKISASISRIGPIKFIKPSSSRFPLIINHPLKKSSRILFLILNRSQLRRLPKVTYKTVGLSRLWIRVLHILQQTLIKDRIKLF